MIGGTVIEVSESKKRPEIVFVDCREKRSKSTCAIYVEKNANSLAIEVGDSVWWQGRLAMWTPKRNATGKKEDDKMICGVDYDIQIRRIGCSGVGHPDRNDK